MTHLTESKLQWFKQKIDTLILELNQTLEGAEKASSTVDLDQSRVGRLSRMDAMQQQAMAQAEQKQLSMQLKQLRQALIKINSNDYGICESCDEEIAIKRLEIQPEVKLCIQCQENSERI